jgi:MFS family permease
MAVAMPFAGKAFASGRLKLAVTIPAIVQAAGIIIRSRAVNLGTWAAAVCLIGPSSAFLMGILTYTLVANWFEKRLGLATGLLATISSVGGVIMNPVIGMAIERAGWRTAQAIIACAVAVTVIPIALFVLRFAPGPEEGRLGAAEGGKKEEAQAGPSYKTLSKSAPFILLLLVGAFLPVMLGLQNMISPHMELKGYSVMQIAFVMSSVMAGSTIAQLLTGILIDRFNQTAVVTGLAVLSSLGWAGMVFTSGQAALAASGVGIGIGAAFMHVALPVIRRRDWGLKAYARATAVSGLFSALVPALSLIAVGIAADRTRSYDAAFLVPILLNALCVLWAAASHKRRYDKPGSKLNQQYLAEEKEAVK